MDGLGIFDKFIHNLSEGAYKSFLLYKEKKVISGGSRISECEMAIVERSASKSVDMAMSEVHAEEKSRSCWSCLFSWCCCIFPDEKYSDEFFKLLVSEQVYYNCTGLVKVSNFGIIYERIKMI